MDAEDQFRTELTALIPALRAFARALTGGNAAEADDVAQDAIARAWAARSHFELGTNLKAWTFRILRNCFINSKRLAKRTTPFDPPVHENLLVERPVGADAIELDELRRALTALDLDQREALILVGAGGFSYEEAAAICGVPAGTMKSRVSRGRDKLAAVLLGGSFTGEVSETPLADILSQVQQLSDNGPAPRTKDPGRRSSLAANGKAIRRRIKPGNR